MIPTGNIGWKPRYSPDGLRVTWERPLYWQAQWLNNSWEFAQNGINILIGGLPTIYPGGNEMSAGGDQWMAFRTDPIRVYDNLGQTFPGAGVPVVNPNGLRGFVDPYQAESKALVFDGVTLSTGAITDVRASRTAIVWSQGGRTWGAPIPGTAREIQAAPTEFRPIPIDTPSGPWVGCHTHTGLILRPFGETDGYAFDSGGQSYYPDWTFRDGLIVAIFTNDAGVQFEEFFELWAPRVPLGAPPEPVPPNPGPEPPEPEPPNPEPPDPPEPGPGPIPPIDGGTMQSEQGWLIGPGDRVLACDADGVVTYPVHELDTAYLIQLDPIDGDRRGTFRPVQHPDLYLTGDATAFAPTGNVCNQVQGLPSAIAAPGGVPGWYQRWDVGQWPSGIVTALVPYIEQGANNGRPWASASLTWIKKA